MKELLDLIGFIRDADKVEARIKAIQAENARLEANIADTRKAGEISKLLDKAKADREEASDLLKQAVAEADVMKKQAKESYDAKNKALAEKMAATDKRAAELDAREKSLDTREATVVKELERERDAVAKHAAALEKERAEVAERMEKLKSVMG